MGTRGAVAAVGPFGPVGPKTITVDGDPSDWTGAVPGDNTGAADSAEFIWNDTAGDDTGNGSYVYPTSTDFNPGLFDIREFRITADAQNLYVLIKLGNLTNAWGGSDGFSTVAAVLLIDTTLDGNGTLTSKPNVNITAGQGWEYYVKIGQTGWQAENAKIFDTAGNWAPIVNKGNATLDAIEVSIPLVFIGKDGYDISGATWGFMFFLQSHAGENTDGFRGVVSTAEAYQFGGCDSSVYICPKIQDIGFSLSQAAQEAELNTFGTDHPAEMASSAQVTFDASMGFVPDTTPPAVQNVTAAPTFNQADVSWITDEVANTTVWYGTTPTPNLKRSVDEFVTSHAVTLSGLDSNTTYYYQVESWDIAGNVNTSAVGTFLTTTPPPANIASWSGSTFVWEDTRGDDTGDGNYVYPNEPTIKWQGRGDIWFLNMTPEVDWIHYSVRINAKPDTIWHQRMAAFVMFIDQDHVVGSGARDVALVQAESDPLNLHPLNVTVPPEFAWEWMIVATFQNYSEFTPGDYTAELALRSSTFSDVLGTYELVYMSTNPGISPEPNAGMVQSTDGGTQLDFWLNRSVVGATDNWTYVAIGALYDDAGAGWPSGGIRQVLPSAQTWQGGGSNGPMNPNIFDLAFYPTTASQEQDLSEYVSTGYTSITNAIQVNLTAQWYEMLSVANVLGISTAASVSEVKGGESAGIVTFTTNRNVAIAGATVDLTADPAAAVAILGSPATTNAFGAAMFTVTGNSVAADTTVTLTATATVGTNTVSRAFTLIVMAPVITHTYRVDGAVADGVLSPGDQTTVTATFTDKGAPISGATVGITSSSGIVDVATASGTTDVNGRATFTVQALYTETDVTATLTLTASNGTATATGTVPVTVLAFAHAYSMSGVAAATIVSENATTTVTFTVLDAGEPQADVTVEIALSSATGFDIEGDASKTTDASGQAVFTLRAKSVTNDVSTVVTATASNGTAADVATASVVVVAQGAAPTTPVTPQGVSVEVFAVVAVLLAAIAAVFAYMWMQARRVKPPEEGTGGT
ncbi:MAG TPA: glucodextranase DOMON-like domain-containing protein [Thermoplasmata archaeon]